ncbi:MAG: hypothetical protein AAGM38_11885 [Pseudomonadota bacterium]
MVLTRGLLSAAAAVVLACGSAQASEIVIYTGGAPTGEGSTYHQGMGKAVEEQLEKIAKPYGYKVRRIPSNGAVANAEACAKVEDRICFGIGQGGLTYAPVESGETVIARQDLPGECAMAFTAEHSLRNWASVVENAARVTFVVPKNSGSQAFVEKLFATDPALEGVTPNFEFKSGQDAIIESVKHGGRGRLGIFYAYPNPTSGLINAAADAHMRVIGVLSPAVAKTDETYYLNRRAPYQLAWLGLGETRTVRAMCTKAMLFHGNVDAIPNEWTREDAAKIVAEMKALPASAFVPQDGPLASLMKRVEQLADEYDINDMVADLEEQALQMID